MSKSSSKLSAYLLAVFGTCFFFPGLAAASEVTLEDLHELLLRQQKVIEEQGRKIDSLQRELDEVKGAPTASGARPANAVTAPGAADATTSPAQGATPASVVPAVPIGVSAPAGSPVPVGLPSADADAAATPTTAPSSDATMKRIDRITKLLERFSINSYGVVTYANYDWQTDQDKRDDVDFEHATFEVVYHATDTVKLEAEVEIEHLGTGSTMEFDKFEEFGEFETEVERGGEVELEALVIEYEPWRWLGVKAGYFPIPIGLNNERHRPQQYFTTTRFESEVALIPSVWTESGVEVFGTLDVPPIADVDLGDVRYHLAGVNGLDSTGFSSANWVKNGHQTRFEQINAEDWAVVARLDYYPIRGAFVGASVYYGDSSDNRPKPDLDVDADVTIWDVHGEYKRGLLEMRGLYMRGHLDNSAAVSLANAQLSNNLNVKRTPVGAEAYAAFIETGFHIERLTRYWPDGVIPFYRYDRYDTMDRVQAPVIRNPFYERDTHTVGLNYRPRDWIVFKGEYSHRERDVSTNNIEETVSIGLGYDFGGH